MAIENGENELLHKLWKWAKEVLTPEELKSMFLATDNFKRNAWYMALMERHIELLHNLWEWAKKALTPDELKRMLLSRITNGRPTWFMTK